MLKNKLTPTTTSTPQPPAHPNISKAALAAIRCSHGHRPPSKPNFSFGLVTSTLAPLCPSQARPPAWYNQEAKGTLVTTAVVARVTAEPCWGRGCRRSPACPRIVLCSCHFCWWMGLTPYVVFFFFLPWKSKSGSWVGREPAKMNSNEPISIEIGSLPCQRLIKPNALNSLQQTRCCRQCPPSCLQEITHNFKIKRIKIQVGVYSYVHTYVPLQGRF